MICHNSSKINHILKVNRDQCDGWSGHSYRRANKLDASAYTYDLILKTEKYVLGFATMALLRPCNIRGAFNIAYIHYCNVSGDLSLLK